MPTPARGPISPDPRGCLRSVPLSPGLLVLLREREEAPELGLPLCSGWSRQPAVPSLGRVCSGCPACRCCPGHSPRWPSTSPGILMAGSTAQPRLSRVSALLSQHHPADVKRPGMCRGRLGPAWVCDHSSASGNEPPALSSPQILRSASSWNFPRLELGSRPWGAY